MLHNDICRRSIAATLAVLLNTVWTLEVTLAAGGVAAQLPARVVDEIGPPAAQAHVAARIDAGLLAQAVASASRGRAPAFRRRSVLHLRTTRAQPNRMRWGATPERWPRSMRSSGNSRPEPASAAANSGPSVPTCG
jgi:hypothetical protein